MNTKQLQNQYVQRRYRTNPNVQPNSRRPEKQNVKQRHQQTNSQLVHQFNIYCASLHSTPIYDFDMYEDKNHRCKMTLSVFPNLQSVGTGGTTKTEAKANAIIAFLAHLEKRKQVGLFVPFVNPILYRNIQAELRRATSSTPDLNVNVNEYLLADRIVSTRQVKKDEKLIYIIQRICGIRTVTLNQSSTMTIVYFIGPKSKEQLIQPYTKALFQPDNDQMFNYGEKLFDVFSDDKFIDSVCQRLKVLCNNHLEECKLFIRGSSVNVQLCYNEFVTLRREFENEYHRRRKVSGPNTNVGGKPSGITTATAQLQSTHIDNNEKASDTEEKDDDQVPDYSTYNDDVNTSMLKVLRQEENTDEQTTNDATTKNTSSMPAKDSPIVIEVSDDSSESTDLQVLQSIKPPVTKKPDPKLLLTLPETTFRSNSESQIPQLPPPPPPLMSSILTPTLRHVVLDGQNVGRNSNDYYGVFSWSRLWNAINYFKNRGHENIIAFLPMYYRDHSNKNLSPNDANRERQYRDTLINSRYIAFTPSRYNNGQRLTNYDDRFILQYAADNDGIVVSNDNFRDLQREKAFQFVINNRILPFATINDTFMPATDPLGRNGPHLDQFLTKTSL
ncbi:unnamed protein product [Adineta ricciae]|uniref:RNase NYN domain-containing protein n=1 Tax=Adineta ricciae TaxID=249248 RepID=A0A814URN2_ADIRI|nr:unnamed protein product [Adineta ricciae]CAF1179258.1 unnamed protein product [Adineta ricciae]